MTYNLRSNSIPRSSPSYIPRPNRSRRGQSHSRSLYSEDLRHGRPNHTRSSSVQDSPAARPSSENLSSSAPTASIHIYKRMPSNTMSTGGTNASGNSQGPPPGGQSHPSSNQQGPPGLPSVNQQAPPSGNLVGHPSVNTATSGGGSAGLPTGSIGTTLQIPAYVATTIPLPQPGSSRAPRFRGRDVEDFIISLEAIGKAAGYNDNLLPPLVLRYCSTKVKDTLEPEARCFSSNSPWIDAKWALLYYFAKSDEPSTTADSLRRFSQKTRRISNKKSFEDYMQEFMRKSGKLVEKMQISQSECDKLFYKGLPSYLRKKIKPTLAAIAQSERKPLSGQNPPPFRRTVDVVRKQFSSDDIDYSSEGKSTSSSENDKKSYRKKKRGSESSEPDETDSDFSSSGSDSKRRSRKTKLKGKKVDTKLLRQIEENNTKISQLEERIKSMTMSPEPPKNFSISYGEPTPTQFMTAYGPTGPNQQYRPQYQSQQSQQSRSCFMCGKVQGIDLDHAFPVKNCLELPGLIDDKILRYHPNTGRLIKVSDSSELILTHRGPGGMAAVLRQEAAARREVPPHLKNASCMAVSLCRDDEPVIKGDVYGSSSHAYYSFPVTTRSQRANGLQPATDTEPVVDGQYQKRVHFRDHRDQPPSTTQKRPVVHPSANEDLQFTHTENQPREYATAPHKVNTREGWQDQQRSRQNERRLASESKDKDKFQQYRFTSDVQSDVSPEEVLKKVLEQKMSISLRELFGISPELQKRMGAIVKTRREFNSQSADASILPNISVDSDDALIELSSPSMDDPGCAILTWDGDPAQLPGFLERYAHAVSARSPAKFYAKATGIVKGIFGNEEVTFLIDSGSELNLITRRVWEQTKVPIDKDGSRWSLRGLGGNPIPLIGCARDAPVQIDGKNFDHHFFVSSQEHGRYDGILGQPWLHWFSADLRYDRFGPTFLQAFSSGDKTGAFISVAITSIDDPRNASKLVLTNEVVDVPGSDF